MKMARVGVLLDRKAAERRWAYGLNVFEQYIGEILSHAGIPFGWLDDTTLISEHSFDIIIAALASENEETASRLWNFAEQGGTLIAYAGLNSLASKLGYVLAGNSGAGYAKFGPEYPKAEYVRYLNARPWKDAKGQYKNNADGILVGDNPQGIVIGDARQRFTIGKGALHRWSVDIPGSIVGFQQGSEPVLEDGIPATDGTGPVNEGILKADDKVEMDWNWDRLTTEIGSPYFAHPYADYWRELLIGHLLRSALEKGLTLPFIGVWPEGIRHVAMISHDSDINQDEHALATLDMLEECGIHSTWCMIEPGYSPQIYERVKLAGHELALHYNALEEQDGKWGKEEFTRQLDWLKDAASLQEVTSNKNHYTRFEGWGELFAYCESNGIQSDQTRGPSKKGNVGFLFGTCHPYFPIAWANERNRMYDVMEIGFLTQDLDLSPTWSDSSVIVPFLDQVMQVGGVAHFLFHQIHIHNSESVRNAFRKVVNEARDRGYMFWTGKQINDWHRARRKMKIVSVDERGHISVACEPPIEGAVAWVPLSEESAAAAGETVETRFGVPCKKQVIRVEKFQPNGLT